MTDEPGRHLRLVFNETGEDPLVLESSWTGIGNREPPDLRNVRQAKPRLRALCILFLLAKYREGTNESSDAPLIFQVGIRNQTWICTLANDRDDMVAWVKTRFHIADHELFLFASPGSMHNPKGKEPPIVEYYPKKLPLANIHLYVKPPGLLRATRRELRGDELLKYAMEFERKHWLISAIEEWLDRSSTGKPKVRPRSAKRIRRIADPDESLLNACSAELDVERTIAPSPTSNEQLDLMFRILIEKEFDRYRAKCKPLFSYVGNSLASAKLPCFGNARNWNRNQIELLRDNCMFYAVYSHDQINALKLGTGVAYGRPICRLDPDFTKTIWESFPERQNIADGVCQIFERTAASFNISSLYDREELCESELLLPEMIESVRTLNWGVEDEQQATALGTFFVQQFILIDFLGEICWPFYSLKHLDLIAASEMPRIIHFLKAEAASNRDLIRRFCNTQREFVEAAQAGQSLLKAQTAFLKALHRQLVALEVEE